MDINHMQKCTFNMENDKGELEVKGEITGKSEIPCFDDLKLKAIIALLNSIDKQNFNNAENNYMFDINNITIPIVSHNKFIGNNIIDLPSIFTNFATSQLSLIKSIDNTIIGLGSNLDYNKFKNYNIIVLNDKIQLDVKCQKFETIKELNYLLSLIKPCILYINDPISYEVGLLTNLNIMSDKINDNQAIKLYNTSNLDDIIKIYKKDEFNLINTSISINSYYNTFFNI